MKGGDSSHLPASEVSALRQGRDPLQSRAAAVPPAYGLRTTIPACYYTLIDRADTTYTLSNANYLDGAG